MATTQKAPTDRVRVRRLHERGRYDAPSIHDVLDAMPMCSVGYVFDGQPYVTPTMQWREGDHVFWHGSSASRMLRTTAETDACLTVSILDGFVLARSGFHHSTNYRSAMILGRAKKIEDPDEKAARLKTFVDGLFPGRWDTLRPATDQEMKATTVLTMPIDEASAKVRTGQPIDDEPDYAVPVWAGVLPVETRVLPPEPDPRNLPDIALPDHVADFKMG